MFLLDRHGGYACLVAAGAACDSEEWPRQIQERGTHVLMQPSEDPLALCFVHCDMVLRTSVHVSATNR